MIEYKKNCPECGVEQVYRDKYVLARATQNNTRCKVCANLGENNPFYGKHQTDEVRNNIKNHQGMLGKHHTEETKRILREINVDRKISEEAHKKLCEARIKQIRKPHTEESKLKMREIKLGKKDSDETKRKKRLAVSEWMRQNSMAPNYNPKACLLIEECGKQYGYNFQHAENGGEYHIEKLGYWVDGYDREKNVVIEVDEKRHLSHKEKDLKRQQEIENLLNCTFIRLTI